MLHEKTLAALKDFPHARPTHYFWDAKFNRDSVRDHWSARISVLCGRAGVKDESQAMQAHRLRDTFAVEALKADVSLEMVSRMLAHSSIKITEKHYNPWVKDRQKQLEGQMRASWTKDPLLR